ncbi:MAG: hypothetical protein ACTSUP_08055 [Candidatus Heimdallarchaeaceae archaeon]
MNYIGLVPLVTGFWLISQLSFIQTKGTIGNIMFRVLPTFLGVITCLLGLEMMRVIGIRGL